MMNPEEEYFFMPGMEGNKHETFDVSGNCEM